MKNYRLLFYVLLGMSLLCLLALAVTYFRTGKLEALISALAAVFASMAAIVASKLKQSK